MTHRACHGKTGLCQAYVGGMRVRKVYLSCSLCGDDEDSKEERERERERKTEG